MLFEGKPSSVLIDLNHRIIKVGKTTNHIITEWPGLEGTSRIVNLQPLHHRQGHQPPHLILDQAAQGPIQPGLECLQGRGIHSLSGQLLQHLTTLIVKNLITHAVVVEQWTGEK